ncbi:S-phase kinase-associated protein 2 [Culicoides brevitarsis]|uniref:S-phase kinase-associated protein 2 n=1 Tax=Culicoides brevitarsis TaxID=469753 RepID=UPI00307C6CB0
MSQIDVEPSESIARKKKRYNSNSENNAMWETVDDEDGNPVKKSANTENKSAETEENKTENKRMSSAATVRSPLAPVENRGAQNNNNNNNNSADDDLENTLLAKNEEFFVYRRDRPVFIPAIDPFSQLSDEMILHIFKWLPKKTLIRCCFVSHRFNKIVHTDILWTRLDLGGRCLKAGALGNVISRGVVILRLASTGIPDPIFDGDLSDWDSYESKLQYLDLSMATISTAGLELLLSKCRKLKKLSLEHVRVTDGVCDEIAANSDIDSLNMTMCEGVSATGIYAISAKLRNLRCLNICWTNLTTGALEVFVKNVTPDLLRLNIAGCRNTMTDAILKQLVRQCPNLVELDVSDCPKLTTEGLKCLGSLKSLEYLSIARCYIVDVTAFLNHHLKQSPALAYLDVFGLLREESLEILSSTFSGIGFNKFIYSSVARPTVGTRRTSIWGFRTRD